MSIYDKYRREIAQKSHELLHSHGIINAYKYADKLAVEALAEGKTEESDFWKAVAASIKPREIPN